MRMPFGVGCLLGGRGRGGGWVGVIERDARGVGGWGQLVGMRVRVYAGRVPSPAAGSRHAGSVVVGRGESCLARAECMRVCLGRGEANTPLPCCKAGCGRVCVRTYTTMCECVVGERGAWRTQKPCARCCSGMAMPFEWACWVGGWEGESPQRSVHTPLAPAPAPAPAPHPLLACGAEVRRC